MSIAMHSTVFSSVSAVLHIIICLFIALYSMLHNLFRPGIFFRKYDIRTAIIVAHDETRATTIQHRIQHRDPSVFGLKRPPILSHAGSRGATEEVRRECWWCCVII